MAVVLLRSHRKSTRPGSRGFASVNGWRSQAGSPAPEPVVIPYALDAMNRKLAAVMAVALSAAILTWSVKFRDLGERRMVAATGPALFFFFFFFFFLKKNRVGVAGGNARATGERKRNRGCGAVRATDRPREEMESTADVTFTPPIYTWSESTYS